MTMQFNATKIAGVVDIRIDAKGDSRGRFGRHFCSRAFGEAGLPDRFVQMNHSITSGKGALRGLHFQHPPSAEDKLVSCITGRVLDVAVDLRRGSTTFLAAVAAELDESRMLFIPKGCAHGFQTLTDDVHLIYLMSAFYAPEHEGGCRYDDPAIGIEWPLAVTDISARDRAFPLIDSSFEGLNV